MSTTLVQPYKAEYLGKHFNKNIARHQERGRKLRKSPIQAEFDMSRLKNSPCNVRDLGRSAPFRPTQLNRTSN